MLINNINASIMDKKMRLDREIFVFELDERDQRKINKYISRNIHNVVSNPSIWAASMSFNNEDDTKEFKICPRLGYYKYNWNDHIITIRIQEEGNPVTNFSEINYYKRMKVEYTDIEILKEFLKEIYEYKPPLEKRLVRLYYSDAKNGIWMSKLSVYAQSIDHIFIDNKIKDSLVSYIDSFIKNKERYISFGRPYKFNVLLHGVPGSGKSSLIKSIAMKYSRPIYILSFSKTMVDDTLISLINQMDNDAILLLEDIDSFFIKRDPGDRLNVSFSCLLNVLDGALTRQGMMCFMTANDINMLDSALIRPGRVDRILRFDYPRKENIRAAYDVLCDSPSDADFNAFYSQIREYKINMSGIIDYLFRGDGNIEDLITQTKELKRDSTVDKLFI